MSSHVTGDAGVDAVLDAVEAVHQENPISSRRYTLIHAYFAHPEAARRAARLGVCVDTQPAWYYKDGDALADALGEARLGKFNFDLISCANRGALGSDFPWLKLSKVPRLESCTPCRK